MFRATSWLAIIVCAPATFAAIGPVSVQSTPTQAILSFTVSDPAQCLVQVYSDAARTQLVDDSNSTLFAGAQRCNRTGSAIEGASVGFVAGLRTSQKASDGKLHSRALAAATNFYYTITDLLSFQSANGSFRTRNPALGNMYPEQPPFDANAWDNRAYPQFNWTLAQRNQMLVDPTSGLLVKRMTFAGDAYLKSVNSTDGVGSPLATAITGSSTCSNTSNLNASGAAYATCTGAAKMFLPLPAFQMSGGGVFNNWYPRFNVDDVLLYVYGSADSTAIGACQRQRHGERLSGARDQPAVFIQPVQRRSEKHRRRHRNRKSSCRHSHACLRRLGLYAAARRCRAHSGHRIRERRHRFVNQPRPVNHLSERLQRGLAGGQPDLHPRLFGVGLREQLLHHCIHPVRGATHHRGVLQFRMPLVGELRRQGVRISGDPAGS